MLQLFLVIVFFIFFVLSGVGFVHFLQKKGLFINRWLFGIASFLVVIIPLTFLKQLPNFFDNIFYLLSGLFAVMFFETSRLKLESGQFKGVINNKQLAKRDRKI